MLLLADLEWEDGSEVVASPRQILRRQLAPAGRAGPAARSPAPSSSSSSSRTPTRRPGRRPYRDLEPANLYNIDYSLLGSARVEPLIRRIRNEMMARRDDGRELEGRVQPRPARDQLPLRRGARRRRRPRRSTRTAPRRSPPRRRWRSPSWRSSTSSRATRATSTARSPNEKGGNAFAADEQLFDRFIAGQLACMRELTLLLRAARQLLQALRARAPSRRPRSPGATTTAPARCAWSATARGCGSRTGCRAPTSTPTWRSRAMIAAGPARDRQRARARARRSRATPTSPTSRTCPTNIYDAARPVRRAARWRKEAFGAGGGRPLPEPRPGRDRRLRGRRHRLGAVPGLRAAVRARARPAVGICAAVERARWGVWEETVTMAPRSYATRRAGGRRARAAAAARRRRVTEDPTRCSTASTR